jgi:hypothetical protein
LFKNISPLKKPWTFEQPLCREVGGELFYTSDLDDPSEMDSNVSNVQAARRLCDNCSHIEDCAEWGIRHEKFGVWGGLSPKDLVDIRKKRNIPLETPTYLPFIDS